jgi:hypothetical protein
MTGAPSVNTNFPFMAAYAWEASAAKQVVYRGGNGHTHELFVSTGNPWAHADLTQITASPLPDLASDYAGYEWGATNTKQVVYLTADGHIHELFVPVGGSWGHADLTQMTGAPLAAPDTGFAAYQWQAGGTKQVVYITENGHVHELFVAVRGSWSHADLSLLTGAPPANTNVKPVITGYEWRAGNTKQVVFLTANNHIHELFVSVGGSWGHADLTQLTGAPPVAAGF